MADLIENPIDSQRVLLTWMVPLTQNSNRVRRAVGELVRLPNRRSQFRYLTDTSDFAAALDEGFDGYPSIPIGSEGEFSNPAAIFRRRLPPVDREDFASFLQRFGLATDHCLSDVGLLGYTGARLAADSFGFCETFDGFNRRFRTVFDIAGFRRHGASIPRSIEEGEPVRFVPNPLNDFDPNAVEVRSADNQMLGHINRLQAPAVALWAQSSAVSGHIFRINGRVEYPRLFVMAEIDPTLESLAA